LDQEVVAVSDYALFLGFGNPVRGREAQATKVFMEATQYYAGLQQKAVIESFEAFLLEPHGGDLGGFFLLRGDKDKLAQLRGEDEFSRLTTRASQIAESVGVISAVTGSRLAQLMGDFEKDTADLR
jgi:hypothetical protein